MPSAGGDKRVDSNMRSQGLPLKQVVDVLPSLAIYLLKSQSRLGTFTIRLASRQHLLQMHVPIK